MTVFAPVVAGCSGSDDEADAPTTAPPVADEIAADDPNADEVDSDDMAVQDFAVDLDMRRYDRDEYESFYGAFLDEVEAGADATTGSRSDLLPSCSGGFCSRKHCC